MDQFGVLVESIGFKAHGKSSAPLADLKATNKSNDNNNINGVPRDIGINQFKSSYNSNTSINDVDLDGIFRSSSSSNDRKVPVSGLDDVFGGFDYGDSVFRVSSSNNYNDDDDLLGLMKTGSGSSSVDHYDVLGNKVSPVIKTNPVDDLLGNFGGMGVKSFIAPGKQANASNYNDLTGNLNANVMKSSGLKKNLVKIQETASEPADLLSDFGVTSSSVNEKSEANPAGRSAEFYFASAEDPFVMFERAQGSSYEVNNGASMVDDYLDFLFSPGTRSNTTSGQSSTTEDAVYDDLSNNNVAPKQKKKASTVSSNNTKHPSSKSNSADDFSYLFGMGVAPPSVEFQEIEGESEERRKARFKHHMTTRDRMNNALNEKNKRDLQVQQEQDERHRVAATLDGDIKRWSVGKEGNLRALLSSLQQVLWAGSGWQPISLTDLITSTAVKKAYHKATLCVHPDKVQQKGASVQQKYIAEKVFDVLKESWNKFNAEEFKKH